MNKILIKNGTIVNEGKCVKTNVIIEGNLITQLTNSTEGNFDEIIDAQGKFILPGCIDDQVHFREPGLTHKAEIFTESKAAVAGGITSYMEMPNTIPNTLTQELLEEKYLIGAKQSIANYSFFMGAGNDNLEEVLKTNPKNVCGIKVFMGSSTGNMLVDNKETLEKIFEKSHCLIATHCEDEKTIRSQVEKFKNVPNLNASFHPIIRNAEACYLSSSMAVNLAKKYKTRLHILHISTAIETELFDNSIPLSEKRITAEGCIHHLYFSDEDYESKGNFIKWNPSIKSKNDREAIWKALLDDRIDVIATDHAPHTLEEKNKTYSESPSGGPLVQHALNVMMDFVSKGKITIEKVAEKMAHNPAILFRITKRGFIRKGYFADLVIVDLNEKTVVKREDLFYKCGWSPFEGIELSGKICTTLVNGNVVFNKGKIDTRFRGQRLTFDQ